MQGNSVIHTPLPGMLSPSNALRIHALEKGQGPSNCPRNFSVYWDVQQNGATDRAFGCQLLCGFLPFVASWRSLLAVNIPG